MDNPALAQRVRTHLTHSWRRRRSYNIYESSLASGGSRGVSKPPRGPCRDSVPQGRAECAPGVHGSPFIAVLATRACWPRHGSGYLTPAGSLRRSRRRRRDRETRLSYGVKSRKLPTHSAARERAQAGGHVWGCWPPPEVCRVPAGGGLQGAFRSSLCLFIFLHYVLVL